MRHRYSEASFGHFYQTNLEKTVQEIEQKRQSSLKKTAKYKILAIVLCLVFTLFIPIILLLTFQLSLLVIATGYIVIWGIAYKIPYNREKTKILTDIKTRVITQIVRFIHADFRYNPNMHIPREAFNDANFFQTKDIDRYEGEDYVKGQLDGVSIEFSEIHAIKQKKDEDKTEITLFRGLFFVIDFHKTFYGTVYAVPQIEKKRGYTGVKKTNYTKNSLQEAKLENPQFNKYFHIRTSDQTLARYIFTPIFMERLLQLQQQFGHSLFFSCQDSKMYLGINTNQDHFDLDIRKPLNKDVLYGYFQELKVALDIVAELNLNQQIWSNN